MSQDQHGFCPVLVLARLALLLIAVPAFSQPASSGPRLTNVQILGPEDPSKQIAVTFWLKQHDKAGLDEMVRQMYDRNSPNYHHWLTPKAYQTGFAPSAEEMAVVREYLATNNLHAVSTDKWNLAITARGTVADVERATGVQLNRVLINGQAHRLPSKGFAIPDAAGKLVYAVQGLNDFEYENHVKLPINPDTGKPFAKAPLPQAPLAKASQAEQYFNANCLHPTTHVLHLKTPGGGPYEIYSGARYGLTSQPPPGDSDLCGYNAPQVETAYGLTSLYRQRLNGNGETIVIVDAYGSDTIMSDASTFAEINGLPQLTSSNFTIYNPTNTNCGGNTCGWDVETSLDVEWSHSVAPGANIALVLANTNSFGDLDIADLYAIENGFGPVVSNSWGIPEAYLATYDAPELIIENAINETGAAFGISVNFSSGDDGDFLLAYGSTTVSMPASSPYATSVGGTSMFLNTDSSIKLQTGWGNNLTRIATYSAGCASPPCDPVLIPPFFEDFVFGAGGGASAVWSIPTYQSDYGLSGSWRLVPDIAYLADPHSGGEVVDSGEDFCGSSEQCIGVVGGTSLACPMFSGMWAIATQAAGTWLGQAAPLLYTLPAGAITDVTAQKGPDNVSGYTVVPPAPPTYYTPAELVPPLENTTEFVSLMYQGYTTRWYALSFGTDTSLTTGPGWDNVTGLGTPNGASFVAAVAGAK